MTFENMILYVKPGCPFCMRVDDFLDRSGIKIEHRSTLEGANREDLIELGGKSQVPCLVVDGEPMYESMDIITYLDGLLQAQ